MARPLERQKGQQKFEHIWGAGFLRRKAVPAAGPRICFRTMVFGCCEASPLEVRLLLLKKKAATNASPSTCSSWNLVLTASKRNKSRSGRPSIPDNAL